MQTCPNCEKRGMPYYVRESKANARACQICGHVQDLPPVEEIEGIATREV